MTAAGTEPEGAEELEHSQALIEEAKGAVAAATPDTIGDAVLDTDASPQPVPDSEEASHGADEPGRAPGAP